MEPALPQAQGYLQAQVEGWLNLWQQPDALWALAFFAVLLASDIARKGWRQSWSRRAVVSVGVSFGFFHANLFFAPAVWLVSDNVKSLYAVLGVPSIPTDFWSSVPVWILVPFAILAYDFADYWNHRLMHMRWLWPVHAIHHSDPVVNGATQFRVHALELVVMWVSYTLLLTWLGLPDNAIGAGAVLLTLHGIYVHIDRDWSHGPFALLIASPRFHRWHHADTPAAYGKNLASVFPFLDVLFGTYRNPGPCTVPMGARGVPENDMVQLTLFPFTQWARAIVRGAAALRRRAAPRQPEIAETLSKLQT